MSITKSAVRKLEKRIFSEAGYLVIPIMATPEQTEAIRQEAKKQGKTTRGIPLCEVSKKDDVKFLNSGALQ